MDDTEWDQITVQTDYSVLKPHHIKSDLSHNFNDYTNSRGIIDHKGTKHIQ